jgi:hypothetical protein
MQGEFRIGLRDWVVGRVPDDVAIMDDGCNESDLPLATWVNLEKK